MKSCVNKNHVYKRECERGESGNEARYVLSGTNIHMAPSSLLFEGNIPFSNLFV